MSASVRGLHLVVRSPDGTQKTHEIIHEKTWIGRDNSNDVIIPVDYVSRKHALLIISRTSPHRFILEDLGSTYGTQVNGVPINRRAPLRIGDEVILAGDIVIRLEDGYFERNPNDDVHRTQRIPRIGSDRLVPAQPTVAKHFDPSSIPNLTLEHLAAIDAGTFELGGSDTDENPSFSTNGTHPSRAEADNGEGPTKHPLGPLFISHSRSYRPEFTRQIYQMLQAEDIDVWVDTENIDVGVSWDQAIEDAMNASWGGLILVSRQSIKSLRCAAERQYYERTYGQGQKQIFVALVEQIDPTELPHSISVFQYVDLSRDFAKGMERLKRSIRKEYARRQNQLAVQQRQTASANLYHPSHVFLCHSYHEADEVLVRQVRGTLVSRGFTVWENPSGLEPGRWPWRRTISSAIEQSFCVIAVVSPQAKQSEWMQQELDHALDFKKPIYALQIRGGTETLFGVPFRAQVPLFPNYNAAIDRLISLVEKK